MKRSLVFFSTALVLAVFTLTGVSFASVPRIDVVFLLDTTGSMGDEIAVVKEKIKEMIAAILLGEPTPDVRFGIVAYRDRGDSYVTKVFDLTRDADRIAGDLSGIDANEGGDYPESLNEALHVAIHSVNWDMASDVSRLIFLIADAPPHLDYPDDFTYQEEIRIASNRLIVVHAIGASGLDEVGEKIYTEIAQATGGTFRWLTYQSQYVADDGDTVTVRVEGRTTTYMKGDSTWTSEGGGIPFLGKGGDLARGVVLADVAESAPVSAAPAARGEAATTSFENNLDRLIAGVVIAEAEKKGVDYSSSITAIEEESDGMTLRPAWFILAQNVPNPFNASTTIRYTVGDPSSVRITIYDLLGRPIRYLLETQHVSAGTYGVVWDGHDDDGRDLPSGVYIVKMRANRERSEQFSRSKDLMFTETRKVLMLR